MLQVCLCDEGIKLIKPIQETRIISSSLLMAMSTCLQTDEILVYTRYDAWQHSSSSLQRCKITQVGLPLHIYAQIKELGECFVVVALITVSQFASLSLPLHGAG